MLGIKNIVLSFCAAAVMAFSFLSCESATPAKKGGWPPEEAPSDSAFEDEGLLYHDEFNGALLGGDWNIDEGNDDGCGENQKQYFKKENVRVSGGKLQILARAQREGGFDFTSGRVTTKNKFSFRYGKIEARIRMPAGAGYVPQFSLLPAERVYGAQSGAIDVVKAKSRVADQVYSSVSYADGKSQAKAAGLASDMTQFHVYALEWEKGSLVFSVDGRPVHKPDGWYVLDPSLVNGGPFDERFYVSLALGIGGDFDKGTLPDRDAMPGLLEVDYMRVYKSGEADDGEELTFADEFSGGELDAAKWSFQNGTGAELGLNGWGNNERQYYRPENLEVSGGTLKITAKKERYSGSDYTSSKIVTQGKFSTRYGRIEARVKISGDGQGIWPAFWMMPEDSVYGGWPKSGEIDIMEIRGRLPGETTSALHYGNPHVTAGGKFDGAGFDIRDWHVYAVEWSEGKIVFCVDEVKYLTRTGFYTSAAGGVSGVSPFDQNFFIILNLAIGGDFDGGRLPPDEKLPAVMEVDYVRAYKKIPV